MTDCWIVLLPPLIVLALALTTKNVIISLLSGSVIACFIATNCTFSETLSLLGKRLYATTNIPDLVGQTGNYGHLYTWGFLVVLGILIQLMTHSGGMRAYTTAISKIIHKARTVQFSSLGISLSFFLDDYLNNFTTGSIMRPLFDAFKLPRVKLAFLLNSMSGPLCLLVPASSWVAFLLGQFTTSGISLKPAAHPLIFADPFSVYLGLIPYLFYPALIIFTAWFIVWQSISFGPMKRFETVAATTGNLFGGKAPKNVFEPETESLASAPSSLRLFFIPLGSFLICIPTMALLLGGWDPLGGTVTWYQAIQQADMTIALFYASLIAVGTTSVYVLGKRILRLPAYGKIAYSGVMLMKNSLILLLLAWTFGDILRFDLQTGDYVAHLVMHYVPLFIIPAALFIVSTLVTAATGSSWGTASIMLPICVPPLALLSGAVPLTPDAIPLLLPTLGAILSGIIAGSHISPITDATIASATSAQCYHIDHVQTQAVYSLPAIIATTLGFLVIPLVSLSYWHSLVVLLAAATLTTAMLLLQSKRTDTIMEKD